MTDEPRASDSDSFDQVLKDLAKGGGSDKAPPEPMTEGRLLDGKLRVVRALGEGAMGAVYEVHHELTRHRRALKLLHAHIAARKDIVDRFLREASAAGRIGNPHIVETHDAGWLSTGEPYVLMEYLEGSSLGDLLASEGHGGLPLSDVATMVRQLGIGVQAAHDAGIVHRDLKPDNLFVATDADGAPFMKVLDFGVSKFDARHSVLEKQTQAGALVGTPGYMSPEQFEDGSLVDPRSDVYALGVILFEMLTGEHPYPAESLLALASKIANTEVAAPSTLRPEIPAAVDRVLAEALVKNPAERGITAVELGQRVHDALVGAPAVVRPSADATELDALAATAAPESAPVSSDAAPVSSEAAPASSDALPVASDAALAATLRSARPPERSGPRPTKLLLVGGLAVGLGAIVWWSFGLSATTDTTPGLSASSFESSTAAAPSSIASATSPAAAPKPSATTFSAASPTSTGKTVAPLPIQPLPRPAGSPAAPPPSRPAAPPPAAATGHAKSLDDN